MIAAFDCCFERIFFVKLLKILFVLVLLSFVSNVFAAPERIALLIGNSDYDGNGLIDLITKSGYVSDLKNPCSDVELIASSLKLVDFGRVETICNLSKTEFDAKVSEFSKVTHELPKDSIVFLYYAGHGMQYYGFTYEIPVLFRVDDRKFSKGNDQDKRGYLSKNSIDLQYILNNLTQRRDVGVFVGLDQCRDDPIDKDVIYNEAVNIRTNPNVLIQYSASSGSRSPDGDGSNSDYAIALADEISKGGDLGDIVSRVNSRLLSLYDKGLRNTYSDSHAGSSFTGLRSEALKLKTNLNLEKKTASDEVNRGRLIFNNYNNDKPSFDIFWCEGKGESDRYRDAVVFAKDVSSKADRLGVGRVMVKPLKVKTNLNEGYNVHRNILRYDPKESKERLFVENIAREYPELVLLPQRGIGVGGKPTPNYMSAFICSGFEE